MNPVFTSVLQVARKIQKDIDSRWHERKSLTDEELRLELTQMAAELATCATMIEMLAQQLETASAHA